MLNLFRRRSMLSCKDVNEFLAAYGEGELDDGLRKRFDEHLSHCPRCKCYLDQYSTTVALVKESGREKEVAPPEELVQLTLSFLREQLGRGSEEGESGSV